MTSRRSMRQCCRGSSRRRRGDSTKDNTARPCRAVPCRATVCSDVEVRIRSYAKLNQSQEPQYLFIFPIFVESRPHRFWVPGASTRMLVPGQDNLLCSSVPHLGVLQQCACEHVHIWHAAAVQIRLYASPGQSRTHTEYLQHTLL